MSGDENTTIVASETNSDAELHAVFNEGIIVIFVMLMMFMIFEALKHKNHWKFGHEASFICLVGMCISGIYLKIGKDEFADIMTFNDDLFFYFILPPIVFASGYNMYRKKFFDNFCNVALFGVLGTLICFGLFSQITLLILKNVEIPTMTVSKETGEW